MGATSVTVPHPIRRRLSDTITLALVLACGAMLLLAILGRIVRDRNILFALMMYLPILPIAAATLLAVIVRLSRRPRAGTKWLIGLGATALLAALLNITEMTGRTPATRISSARVNVTVMQWNVQWGGREIFPPAWDPTARAILAEAPDILVLNEAPADERIARLCRNLGDTWTFASRGHEPKSRYWYNVAVASRWPVRFGREVMIPNGAAMSVLIEAPERALRVLVVDGISDPRILRTPMLHAVAAYCRDEAAAGRAVDIIAGDFNAMSSSIGFDALRQQRFALASDASGSWRGTFPMPLLLYDIDHIWVGRALRVAGCGFVRSTGTNHRGIVARVVGE